MNKIVEITSPDNKHFKNWKKLKTKRGRQKSQQFLVEGYHLVEEALHSSHRVQALIIAFNNQAVEKFALPYSHQLPIYRLNPDLIGQLADTQASQGIFAVVASLDSPKDQIVGQRPYLLVDEVQDPGNLGTLIRTADAAGMEAVFIGKGTVDPYNDKTLRSAQGSHFHLPIVAADLKDIISMVKEKNYLIYGTNLDKQSMPYHKATPCERFALIVGNEGQGVKAELLERTDQNLHIPMRGRAESLNVAIAASILIFSLSPAE